jgi:hypothetical protein
MQASNFNIDVKSNNYVQVNGARTLPENIADTGGLLTSFRVSLTHWIYLCAWNFGKLIGAKSATADSCFDLMGLVSTHCGYLPLLFIMLGFNKTQNNNRRGGY